MRNSSVRNEWRTRHRHTRLLCGSPAHARICLVEILRTSTNDARVGAVVTGGTVDAGISHVRAEGGGGDGAVLALQQHMHARCARVCSACVPGNAGSMVDAIVLPDACQCNADVVIHACMLGVVRQTLE